MSLDASQKEKSKKSKRKKSNKISFDTELVTKDTAKEILSKHNNERLLQVEPKTKHTKKNPQKELSNEEIDVADVKPEKKIAASKKNRKRTHSTSKKNGGGDDENKADTKEKQTTHTESNSGKTEESIRAKKRRKYAELLKNKKMQAELQHQQKGLNYLSRWKHNRLEWKFEKLRQIWLQQNMYDDAKLPDEFWDVLVEYFNSAKGKIKEVLTNQAVKIIEDFESKGEQEIDDDIKVKLKRAKSIIQNLQ